MADIAKDAKISPDGPVLKGFSRLSSTLWRQVWKQAPGTLSGDAKALHDMRVAIRRLRSLLQNFEGEKKAPVLSPSLRREIREKTEELGKIGDGLGAVRDHDVLDDYLKTYARQRLKTPLDAPETKHDGLLAFEKYLQAQRSAAFAPMTKRINKANRPGNLQENFARWALGLPGASGAEASLREIAGRLLPVRIDEILDGAAALNDTHDEIGHHEFRKSLRRLRYTLETLGPCYDADESRTKERIQRLVGLQDVLGEMQDRTVLHEKALEAFKVAKQVEADAALPADIAMFLHYGANRKRRLLTQARAQWRKMGDENFFEELRNA